MAIKQLFDPSKDIYRTIEKVITYNASQEARLKAEITEYIVTESIEEQFEKLLGRMQLAMDVGEQNEVGVWVAGFYGSGKSSFTKYLGLALDERVTIDGVRFLKHLQDRLHRPQTKALLNTIANRYPTAVVLLDLASEMLAGATMEDVSTVLYYKVLQWAGYSRNLKVAAFERKLQKDGRYEEFKQRIQNDLDAPWNEVQNDPLVIDSLIPDIAHDMYPQLFRSADSFSTESGDFVRFENERVREMIEIAREVTGKEHILFIVDEVGQYVASRPNLILNLDGLAKNLKSIGDGKVWIIGTAQQTLTEDDPRAALNSPELYKLKDRFPIQIELESSDIKEISYRRLLGKSPEGERVLGSLFERHGQALRHNTKLDARYYDADFDRTTFVNLYPFMPAHFDVLLHLLGALAKSTGGLGLRSAIKVVQDILVEGIDGQTPVADQEVGWLATTVTLYDALHQDIRRASPSIYKAVSKALMQFNTSPIHTDVAKTVAVLQILDNMAVTPQNIAALMHPTITAASQREQVDSAIRDLIANPYVPFGEKDGNLGFFSEKLNDIEQERAQIALRSLELRRIQNEALREDFNPLPSTRLEGTLAVTAGLKVQVGSMTSSVAGEREPVQLIVEFVAPQSYETARTRLVDEARHRNAQHTIFLLGRSVPDIEERVADIFRSEEVVQRYRSDPDQEVRDYCSFQLNRAARLRGELEHQLKRQLGEGSFIFRGQLTAVDSLDHDVLEATKKLLAQEVAEQVFERYKEAPIRVETALAEKFLRVPNLRAVTTQIDPLGLVQITGGVPRIKADHKALVSIRDYIDRNGTVDGKRLSEHFGDAPFGWSPDTLRYLVAALLIAGEISLKLSGREVTVIGQQAIDALRTNNSFKTVGVALRDVRPSMAVLDRAASRLGDITGDDIIPLEDDIGKAATRKFPELQLRYGPLAEKLDALGLPGGENVRSLTRELADVLQTDGSDAPQRLGGETSSLYDGLKWAADVDRVLQHGLESTIRDLQEHRREILSLPNSGIPGQLRADVASELEQIGERLNQHTFYQYAADFNSALTGIKSRVRDSIAALIAAQQASIKDIQQELPRVSGWTELIQMEQASEIADLEGLVMAATADLGGLRRLMNQAYTIQSHTTTLKRRIEQLGRERERERIQQERERIQQERERIIRGGKGKVKFTRSLTVPAVMTKPEQIDDMIQRLQALRAELHVYNDIEVTFTTEG